jgi:hypothetical protein
VNALPSFQSLPIVADADAASYAHRGCKVSPLLRDRTLQSAFINAARLFMPHSPRAS